MTSQKFVAMAKKIAKSYRTLYVMGCFGAPLNQNNKARYTDNHPYNRDPSRTAMIKNANHKTFGFDCVGLIKGILWGWYGDLRKPYGGAEYLTGGVPDIDADGLMDICKNKSTVFTKMQAGEILWCEGHVGIYIGNGLAVECSPSFENKVQITAVSNIGKKRGYNHRMWKKHGKLPFITYPKKKTATVKSNTTAKKTETKTATDSGFRIGDKVTVNGKIYYYGNGGINILKKNETMYVVDIVNKSAYKYFIGVASAKNGVRQGWANPEILKK